MGNQPSVPIEVQPKEESRKGSTDTKSSTDRKGSTDSLISVLGKSSGPTELPEQFITQSYGDWRLQLEDLYKKRPTITRVVILPPGVALNDERLAEGTVAKEKRTMITGDAILQGWPEDKPFEADVDAKLLPPCKGTANMHAHYAIYPDSCFEDLPCGYCELHKVSHPELDQDRQLRAALKSFLPKERPAGDFAEGYLTAEEMGTAKKLVKIRHAS